MKRTPLLRSKPLESKTSVRILKQRNCANCKAPFRPFTSLVKWCSPSCGAELGMKRIQRAKTSAADKVAREEKRKTRAAKEALKTIPQLKKEAQREFNRWVRARDRAAGFACICCGRQLAWDAIGGEVDAGHYRSTGSADHLRFDERNCHAQRADCNRYGAGRVVDYRAGLIARLGAAVVEGLETDNTPIKWTREGLREIRDTYRQRANELEKQL